MNIYNAVNTVVRLVEELSFCSTIRLVDGDAHSFSA